MIWKSLVLTTEGIYLWNTKLDLWWKMTSYDPYTLQKVLATWKENDCRIAIVEVSSHWLDQYRFEWIGFDMWVLTNITPEHLDYFHDMEFYSDTKKLLFKNVSHNKKNNKLAVFPKDDVYWRERKETMIFDRSLWFWITNSAEMRASNIVVDFDKTSFDFQYLWDTYALTTKLLGEYNVYNILAALSAAVLAGIDIKQAIEVVERFEPVNGRAQYVKHDDVNYYIDYGHTPDALKKIMLYLQWIKGNGRLLVMRWGAWNRDRENRALMWEVLEELSDLFVITEDDSDDENKFIIMQDILKWVSMEEWQGLYIIADRGLAMDFVIWNARAGDVVLIAGKGHESMIYGYYGKKKWNDMVELKKRLDW